MKAPRRDESTSSSDASRARSHLPGVLARLRSRGPLGAALVVALLAGAPSPASAQSDDAPAAEGEGGDAPAEGGGGAPRGDAPREGDTEGEASQPAPTTAPTLGEDATPEERAALEAYQRTYARYTRESEDYQSTVDGIVESKYRQKVAEIQRAYNGQIKELTAVERSRRVEAIAAFEAFVARYPRNAKYTPDALFRLAELYFEKANDDYLLADEQFQEELTLYEAGKIPDMPRDPERDYADTIRTFRKLISDWPDYRLLDGAYYLLAYCELQMGNDESARDLFMTLIDERPDSRFIPEAWIRIGEFYFDDNELDSARIAYAEAMKFPESRFFDKALYKLAWTHYRQDNFGEAIESFKRLVEYSDEQEAKTGRSGSVLRAESVQYMAISLAESDWDSDGIGDNDFGLARAQRYLTGDKPYEREVLVQLAEYLFEAEFFAESIDVIRYALNAYPLHPENPQLFERLVLAMFRNDEVTMAFNERRKMGELYGPGGAWYDAQRKEGNAEAMRYASNLVKDNLIQSATWFHEQAQKERDEAVARQDEAMLASSRQKYALAARTYAEFLRKHPNDKDAYQWNYYYAETLFYSEQYLDAHEQYRAVREMDLRAKEFEEIQEACGFNAVKALELVLEQKIAAGQLPGRVLGKDDGGGASEASGDPSAPAPTITAEPLPELARKYVTAMDRYVVLGLKNKQDPLLDSKFAFQAAKMFYDFNDFPEARRRFDWIIKNYPERQVGAFAASLTLETYRVEKDFETMGKKAEEYIALLKGDEVKAIKAEIAEYELAVLFKAAEKAYAEKRYEDAIKGYLELISRDKEEKYTTIALINAAVAYEVLDKPGEASRFYERLYTEYPDDDFAPYALYRVAINSERFFDFDKATQNYLAFYDRFGDKDTPDKVAKIGFNFREKGPDALRNGAILLENMQRYRDAADRYVEYSTRFSDKGDADDVYWQAIGCWKKSGLTRDMLRGYERYIDTHGSAENSEKVFKALGELYEYHASKGREVDARKWYQRTLDEYARYGIQPGSPEAFFAAQAQFMLAEYEFEEWDEIKLRGKVQKQGELLKEKIEGQKALTPRYEQVYAYRNLEWTLAAGYRIGNMYQSFAQMLYDAPVPFPEDSEQWDIYRGQLDDIAIPLEDKAVESYVKVIEKAREEKIVNAWTKKTLAELNKYRPAEYPLYKQERRATTEDALSGLPLLDRESYEKATNPRRDEENEGNAENEDEGGS